MEIVLTINEEERRVEARPEETLLDLLRRLGYHSVKFGCGEGACGACTVLLDSRPVNSCLVLAVTADRKKIRTVDALGTRREPHPLQTAFVEAGAVQCGYCTPGMILSAAALLERTGDPSEEEIRMAIDGNLCRCTGYVQIVEAVQLAAGRMKKPPATPRPRKPAARKPKRKTRVAPAKPEKKSKK